MSLQISLRSLPLGLVLFLFGCLSNSGPNQQTLHGTLAVSLYENANSEEVLAHTLTDSSGRQHHLRFSSELQLNSPLFTGQNIALHGVQNETDFLVTSIEKTFTQDTQANTSRSLLKQTRSVLVIRASFEGKQAFQSKAQIEAHFNRLNQAFEESTSGLITFDLDRDKNGLDIFDVSLANFPSPCLNTSNLMTETIQSVRNQASAAVKAQYGVDAQSYRHVVIYVSSDFFVSCGQNAYAVGDVGPYGNENNSLTVFMMKELAIEGQTSALTHELGHNLGLLHAGGPGGKYADKSSFMGNPDTSVLLNAPQRDRLGVFDRFPGKAKTAPSGKHRISELNANLTSTLDSVVLKSPRKDGYMYFVSLRRASRMDTSLKPEYLNKVFVHHTLKPGFVSQTESNLVAVLDVGQRYQDIDHLFELTVNSISNDGSSAEVDLKNNITANFLPPNLSAGTVPDVFSQDLDVRHNQERSFELLYESPESSINVVPTIDLMPKNGTVSGSGFSRSYVPKPGYTGEDEIRYHVSNEFGDSRSALIRFSVKAPPPTNLQIPEIMFESVVSEKQEVQFQYNLFDSGGSMGACLMDFGDGTEKVSCKSSLSKLYKPGTYTACVQGQIELYKECTTFDVRARLLVSVEGGSQKNTATLRAFSWDQSQELKQDSLISIESSIKTPNGAISKSEHEVSLNPQPQTTEFVLAALEQVRRFSITPNNSDSLTLTKLSHPSFIYTGNPLLGNNHPSSEGNSIDETSKGTKVQSSCQSQRSVENTVMLLLLMTFLGCRRKKAHP